MGEAENGRRAGDRYRTYEAMAAGGMATVHYGRMLGPLGFARTVAIKRLHREYARDPEFVAMFIEEARLAARIHHPNVVQTLDVVSSDGEIALIMEYVPAVSLAQLLLAAQSRGERLPSAVAASILVGVLQGLHAAHEATDEAGNPLDIVHRDVSPQNILVGADGCARVLDFGIAKATGRATQVTREGQVKGKFAYMAPEQVTNVGVTRQSDIFAASIVLWESLTGTRLFKGDSEPAVLARVLSAPIEPPSKVAPEIGPELDAIVLRGLARDLSARYGTGRDMARDIEAHTSLASASQVGEWVEHLAGDDLASRAARVAQIENESRGERASPESVGAAPAPKSVGAPPAPESVGAPPAPESVGAPPAPESVGAPPAPESAGATGPAREPHRESRYRTAALVAVAVVSAAAIGARVVSERNQPSRVAEPPAPPRTAAPAAPAPPSAEATVAARAPAPPEPPGAILRPAPSIASVRTARAAEVKPPPVRPAVPSASAAAQTACDPPYYADSKGHLIYKAECFR